MLQRMLDWARWGVAEGACLSMAPDMKERGEPGSGPRIGVIDEAIRRLKLALSRARGALLWERAWPAITAVAAVSGIFLAFSWAGSRYDWASPQIIGMLSWAVAALAVFAWAELRAEEPLLPMRLFRNPIFLVSAIVTFLTGVAMFGWRVSQDPVGAAAGAGLNTAMTAFLSWVLARELDPDRTITAAWALPAGATVTAFLGAGALLPLYLLAMTSRLLARTTGLPPTTPDLIFNGLVAVVAARHTAGWAVGLAFAFALARDAGLSNPAPRRQMVWSLGVAAAVTAVATWQGLEFSAPPAPAVSIALAGLIAGWTLPVESPNSVADLTFFPLDGYRLRSARRTALAALVLAGLTGGGEGLVPLAPGWLTLLATGVISRLRTADRP